MCRACVRAQLALYVVSDGRAEVIKLPRSHGAVNATFAAVRRSQFSIAYVQEHARTTAICLSSCQHMSRANMQREYFSHLNSEPTRPSASASAAIPGPERIIPDVIQRNAM